MFCPGENHLQNKMYVLTKYIFLCSKSSIASSQHKYETCHGMGGQRVEVHIKHQNIVFCCYCCTLPVLFVINDDF